MTMPAVAYFQSATSSFLASATIVVFLRRPPLCRTRSWNQRLSAEAPLVPQPQPRQFDHHGPQPRVARLRHALFMVDGATLPRRGCQARIGGQLAPVVEVPEEPLRPKGARDPGADALEPQQHLNPPSRVSGALRREQGIPLRLDRVDLAPAHSGASARTARRRYRVPPAARACRGGAARSRRSPARRTDP